MTGVPVICSALASNQELVRGDENGPLAAVGDPVSLADAMARCLTDEGLRARLAEAEPIRAGVHLIPGWLSNTWICTAASWEKGTE